MQPRYSCVFCRIGQGESRPLQVVCEHPDWLAFFPDSPASLGHTLVIPRVHVSDVWALEPPLSSELMTAVIEVGRAIRVAVQPEGMNLISSSGTAAEQTVFHVHFHLVPRWDRDRIDPIWPPKEPIDDALKEDVASRIRRTCAQTHAPNIVTTGG